MEDNYPTEDELSRIRQWSLEDGWKGLLSFAKTCWWAPDWGWRQRGRRYSISTGGWSGNEDIIAALQENKLFWIVCWISSRRGGHYVFEVPQTHGSDVTRTTIRDVLPVGENPSTIGQKAVSHGTIFLRCVVFKWLSVTQIV